MVTIFLGIGGNLGDRAANLRQAIERLEPFLHVKRIAPLYETDPIGYRDQPKFLNTVIEGETTLPPRELLQELKRIEVELGRVPSFRNAPRPVDLDILLYGEAVVQEPDLEIPHRRMVERAFVLVPLADLAPDFVHPTLRLSVRELRDRVPGSDSVRRYEA